MSIVDYLTRMKKLVDNLTLAGKDIELNNFAQHILTGLDSSYYESLVTNVLARRDKISTDELYSLLLVHENKIKGKKKGKITSNVTFKMTAHVAKKKIRIMVKVSMASKE